MFVIEYKKIRYTMVTDSLKLFYINDPITNIIHN